MQPRWKSTMGVLGIIFGSFGVLSSGQIMFLPTLMNFERQMFSRIAEGPNQSLAGPMSDMLQTFLAPSPAWFMPLCIGLGILGLMVSGLYVFSGISLLLARPSAPRLFCMVLVASVVVAIIRIVAMILAQGMYGIALGMGGSFGVVIDLVLLAVMLSFRSQWYANEVSPPPVVAV